METIIGFVAGYLAGTREGKAGLKKLQESWQAIRTSPEAHRLAADALSFAEAAAKQVSGRGFSAVGQGVRADDHVPGGQPPQRFAGCLTAAGGWLPASSHPVHPLETREVVLAHQQGDADRDRRTHGRPHPPFHR